MVLKETQGVILIPNLPKYEPFKVTYDEIDTNTVQVDCVGTGCVNYFEKLDAEIEMEINIGINNRLREYSELTGHNSEDIGYSLKFNQSTTLNRKYNTLETSVELSIVFKKPVVEATTHSLTPTIELITSIILSEIFILQP
jgi:hypothetical protein